MHDALLAVVVAVVTVMMAPYVLWACIIAWELIKHPPKHG